MSMSPTDSGIQTSSSCSDSEETPLKYQLRLLGVPPKNRVETQLKVYVQLLSANGDKLLPEEYPSHLSLPSHQVSKQGSNDNPFPVLHLAASIICASDSSKQVTLCCSHCQDRERKRYATRRVDFREILYFNTGPFIEFPSGNAYVPIRITCYCRHHEEQVGFSLTNESGVLVARGISSPCLITDDHKKLGKSEASGCKRQRSMDLFRPIIIPSTNFATTNLSSVNQPSRNLSPTNLAPLQITKIVPPLGPTHGGIEITIIGQNLHRNTSVSFGTFLAAVEFFSENVIVCILPSCPTPGPVCVTVTTPSATDSTQAFCYTDTTDTALMEIALLIVGMNIKGSLHLSASEIAQRIVSENSTLPSPCANIEQTILHAIKDVDAAALELMDIYNHSILSLACCAGYAKIVDYVCKKGATGNAKRSLMFAELFSRAECVAILANVSNVSSDLLHNLAIYFAIIRPSASESLFACQKSPNSEHWVSGKQELGRTQYWMRLFCALVCLAILHYIVLGIQGYVADWILAPHIGGAVRVPLM